MRRSNMLLTTCFWLLSGIGQTPGADENPGMLVVHEWGTFTELHDSHGNSLGGINTDDEPVPEFVHRVSSHVLQSTNEPWRPLRRRIGKAVPWNAAVTTRLETPGGRLATSRTRQ